MFSAFGAHEALRAAVDVATAPSARSATLLLHHLGKQVRKGGHDHFADAKAATTTPAAMEELSAQMPPLPDLPRVSAAGGGRGGAAAGGAAVDTKALLSSARIDLVRLSTHLHEYLMSSSEGLPSKTGDATYPIKAGGVEEARAMEAVAAVALTSAPLGAAKILAKSGCWFPLLFSAPMLAAPLLPTAASATRAAAPHLAVPCLRQRLKWLREAAAEDSVLDLVWPPFEVSPQLWARVLAAVEQDGADGHMPDDRSGAAAGGRGGAASTESLGWVKEEGEAAGPGMMAFEAEEETDAAIAAIATARASYQCADVQMLLTLALLLPRSPQVTPPVAASPQGPAVGSGGGALGVGRGSAPATLGRALEVFLRYWLRQAWPLRLFNETLRTQMRGASLALCWLLEHRPALVARASLSPTLLLDAVRIAAAPQPAAPGVLAGSASDAV